MKKYFSWRKSFVAGALLTVIGFTTTSVIAAIAGVTVTAPDGGETVGGTYTITWDTAPLADPGLVNLYYCAGANCGTNSFTAIVSGEANDGSYAWNTAGVTDGSTYKVRVASAGDIFIADLSDNTFTIDNTAPSISSVSITDTPMKINDTVTATITVGDDAGVTYTLVSGSVSGFALGNLARVNSTTYTAEFTVTEGGTDVAALSGIPVANLVLADIATPAANMSSAFAGTITQNNDRIDANRPTLSAVSISTNNPSGTHAKTGDTVSLVFTANETINTPSVTIAGGAASLTDLGSNMWRADYTLSGGETEGIIAFSVAFADTAGNSGTNVTAVSDSSSVIYDKTSPTAALTYAPNRPVNAGTALTITATFDEAMADAPVVNLDISGVNTLVATAMTKVSATSYTYVHTVGAGDGSATVALSVGTDVAGNLITAAPTSGASFAVDNTAPTNQDTVFAANMIKKGGVAVTIVSSGDATNEVWFAPAGTTVFVAGSTMTKATDGTATTITSPADEGAYKLFVVDQAGNISVASTATLTVDNTPPVITSLVLSPSSGYAKIGDTVTITITADANDYANGSITVNGVTTTGFTNNNDNTYSATYTVVNGDTDRSSGTTPASVVLTDVAGNSNVAFSTVTVNTLKVDAHVPTLVQATTTSITTIDVRFSEDLDGNSPTNADFTISGHTLLLPDGVDEITSGIVRLTISDTLTPDETPTVNYNGSVTDNAGNAAVSPVSIPAADGITPTLTIVHIQSDNANTTLAKQGNTVALAFTADEPVSTPIVVIQGVAATVVSAGGNAWTASRAMSGTDTEGAVTFTIDFSDMATMPNAGAQVDATTDSSSVLYDRTNPSVDAGSDKEVNAVTTQDATVIEAGSGVMTYAWTGPGALVFGTPAAEDTTISATAEGTYVARLTVTDNAGNSAFDELTIVWDITAPEFLTSSPINSATAVSALAGTATVTFDTPILMPDDTKIFLVKDSDGSSVRLAVATSSPTVLTVGYSALGYGVKYRINIFRTAISDVAGNLLVSSLAPIYFTTEIDTTAPVINALSADPVTATGATLLVTTDEIANCRYGTTDSSFASMTAMTSTGATSHSQAITGLTASTAYDYYVRCADTSAQANTMITSAHVSFTTSAAPDTTAPPVPVITTGAATVNSNTYVITGTAAADTPADSVRTITLMNAASVAGSATLAVGQTNWSILVSLPQDAASSFTAIATDAAGKESSASAAVVITEDPNVGADLTAPAIPSISTLAATVDADTYTISGTAGADTPTDGTRLVRLYNGTTLVGSVSLLTGQTDWSLTVSLNQNTTNSFTATSADAAGNASVASSAVVITEATAPDTTAPTFSNIQATSFTTTGATITWTTNELATSRVEYGLTSSYGSLSVADASADNTSHSVALTGLSSGTMYHYRVVSADTGGFSASSTDATFVTTANPDTTAPPVPVITTTTNTVNSNTYVIAGTSAADVPSDTIRTITVMNGTATAGSATVPVGQTSWSVLVSLLQNATSTFTAIARDAAGNPSAASNAVDIGESELIGADVTAPAIPVITTAAPLSSVNADTYELSGTAGSTGEVRTVTVYRGGSVVGTAVLSNSQTTWTVTVSLNQDSANVFTATSMDAVGNESAASASVTITEATPVDSTAPTFGNIQVGSVGTSTATVTWTTDEAATSRIEYGATSAYGSMTTLDSSLVTTHSIALSGLTPNTTYHYRVVSADTLTNNASSTDSTFATNVDDSTATLVVNSIDTVQSSATPDNTFGNGWKWTFHVTVPTTETAFSMKFANFISGANSVPAASNIRFYSAQSLTASTTASAITIGTADTYSSDMTLTSDANPSLAGRQIDVTVEVRVPVGTPGGSYGTSYGVKSL